MTNMQLQELLDRAEINDLITAYGQGSDLPDLELHLSVYAPDIVLELDDFPPIKGVDALRAAMADGSLGKKVTGCTTQASTHAMVNARIDIDGDEATGIVYGLIYLIGTREGAPYAATRGLLYTDRYRRIEGKWLITYRRHALKWQIEGTPSPLPAAG
jgi:hypothetical protein